jgi:hypothetical protein
MDSSHLGAKAVVAVSSLSEYESGMSFFYSELVELNVILYLAEKIVDFPFDLFSHPDKTVFFSTVMRSFHDSAVLIITRLITDQKGDLFTFRHFKNRVRELVTPEFRSSFEARLKKARFDREIDILLEKVKELRRNRIAHTTQDLMTGSILVSRPTLSELKVLRDALNSLLDALSFNVEQTMLPHAYDPNIVHAADGNHKTDIEEVLDSIAKDSHLLNMPDKYPERWRNRRRQFSEENINQLNFYRRKFGLPDVE